MADLIIKPNSATGDKLILQDRAGGAVLTTADSGATIANATLNSPTLVTPALGTPASGVATNITGIPAANLTGTLATARMADDTVIQTLIDEYHRTSALSVTTTLDDHLGSNLEVSGTFVSTSNKLLIWLHVPDLYTMAQGRALHTGFQYDDDSGFGSPTTLGNTTTISGAEFWLSTGTANFHVAIHATFAVPVAGSAIYIRPTFQASNNTLNLFNNSSGTSQKAYLTVQEIKG